MHTHRAVTPPAYSYIYRKRRAVPPKPSKRTRLHRRLVKKNLKAFYANFPMYMALIVTKVQMLDPSHLLIKYGPSAPPSPTLRAGRLP
jgi:hypothetical protein